MILFIENSKDSTQNLLEVMDKFSRAVFIHEQ